MSSSRALQGWRGLPWEVTWWTSLKTMGLHFYLALSEWPWGPCSWA
uniref:Uncharacterized protein n=1 Tax=Anguilla anguilla TaxID=7936 RepID=A0A0E9R8I2_ANGAN